MANSAIPHPPHLGLAPTLKGSLQENKALAINTSQGDVNAIVCNTTVRTEPTGRTLAVDHWTKLLSILQPQAIVEYKGQGTAVR